MSESRSKPSIWSRVGYFTAGLLVASIYWQASSFLETCVPPSQGRSHLSSEEFAAICESTRAGSRMVDLLLVTSSSVLNNRCSDGKCTVSIEGGTGMFYDVCMIDYEKSSGDVIEAVWIYGDQ